MWESFGLYFRQTRGEEEINLKSGALGFSMSQINDSYDVVGLERWKSREE